MATVAKDFRVKNGLVAGSKIQTAVPSTTIAPLNIPHGNAPSSPVNGDIWTTSAGLYARINNVTVGPFGTGGAVEVSDTAPSSPITGTLWYQSSTGYLFIYYDSFWIHVGPGGGGSALPLTTTGDIIYSSSGSTAARLGIGTAGQALVVNSGATAPAWTTLTLENLPGAFVKRAVKAATTANVTLAGGAPSTLDGVTLVANDRILVKDQSAPAQNGIYIVQTLGTGSNGTWVRSADADTIDEIASAIVAVDQGTVNGGLCFDNDNKTNDTLGTTAITWNRIVDAGYSVNLGTTSVPLNRASGALTLAGITLSAPTFTGTMTTSLTTSGYVTTTSGGVLGSVATIPNAGLTNSSVTIGSTSISLGATSTTLAGLTSVSATTFTGSLSGTATNATNTAITNDTATASTVYPTWVNNTTGNLAQSVTSTRLTFVPSTGVLTATQFSGSGAGLTSIPQSAVTNLTTDLAAKANVASPTFTGKVTTAASATGGAGLNLPHGTAPTSPANGDIWTTTAGLFAQVNGTTVGPYSTGSALPLTTTGDMIYSSSGSTAARLPIGTAGQALVVNSGATAPAWTTLTLENLPDAAYKRSVRAATTANITLSGTQTIDGIAVISGDRVLVKDQSTPANNGIYVVASGAWTRATDSDTISEIAGATVNVDSGTQGGQLWTNNLKTTDTLGTTSMVWSRIPDTSYSVNIGTTAVQLGRASGALTLGGITLSAPTFTGTMTTSLTTAGIVTTTAGGVLGSTATVPIANGGTGLATTPTNGQLLIGNGTGYSLATLTQGSGITITNGAGTITIAASGSTGGASISDTAPSSPTAGQFWWESDTGKLYVYYTDANTSQWVEANSGAIGPQGPTGATGPMGNSMIPYQRAGNLSVDVGVTKFRFPVAATILGISATVNTAPTGAAIIMDVNKNGTTIFSTQANRPQIAASALNTASEVTNMDITSIAAGDFITVDIDQVGSTVPGADLTILVRYSVP